MENINTYYEYANAYNSYLNNKIDNEVKITSNINSILSVNESYRDIVAVNEAKIAETIQKTWERSAGFIKRVFDKFVKATNNIVAGINEKYLEKYKDIILNKKGKESEVVSFRGDFIEATKRIMASDIKLFNASMVSNIKLDLDKDTKDHKEYTQTVKQALPNANNIKLDDTPLADSLKDYFIAADRGDQDKKFSDLNFTDMYNFCHNFNKVRATLDKDIDTIEKCGNEFVKAMQNTNVAAEESAKYIKEADENNKDTNNNDNNNDNNNGDKTNAGDMDAEFSSDKDAKDDENNNNPEDEEKKDTPSEILKKCSDRYKEVISTIITAKMTAIQHIAEIYMKIIRKHIQSYGGKADLTEEERDENKTEETKEQNKED